MKKAFCIFCVALFYCILYAPYSYAQDFFEQSSSPETSALIQQAETNLDHSSGVVNINLPLHVINAGNISIPISLSYHASGIKLNDQASSVGLGWNFSHGGKITRVVKGDNDLMSGNYSNGLKYRDGISLRNYIWGDKESKYENYNQADSEPDLFYYEIPGKSGMFVLDHIGQAIQIPYQNVHINYVPYLGYFAMTDYETGTVYTFGDNYDSREYTQATFPNENIKKDGEETIRYASTWYITSIVTLQGETATFKYKTGPGYGHTEINQETRFTSNINNGQLDQGDLNFPSSIKQKDSYLYYEAPKYIEQIDTENQIVYFESSGSFKLRYDAIRVKYKSHEEPMPEIRLHYGTFKNNELKLEKITRNTSQTDELLYRFHYNPNNELPGPGDTGYRRDFDHWGYYNMANNQQYRTRIQLSYDHWKDLLDEDDTVIPPSFAGRPVTSDSGNPLDYQFPYCPNCNEVHGKTTIFPGASREPHILGTLANVLQKIEYGTGGYVSFSYEENIARTGKGVNDYRTVGGLRTRSITTSDGVNSSTVNYKYQTDRSNSSYQSGIQSKNICTDYYYTVSRGDKNMWGEQQNLKFRIYQRPIYNIGDAIGNNVTYSTVFEEHPDGSYIKYEFTSSLDPGCFDIKTIYVVKNSSGTVVEREYNSHDELLPKSSLHWRRGLLKSVEQYDSAGNLVSHQMNKYRFEEMGQETTGYIMSPRGGKEFFGYKWISEAVLLESVITEKGPYNTRITQNNDYDPVFKIPVKTTYTDDELNRIENITTYAHHYSPSNPQPGTMAEACSLLNQKGIIAPIEKIVVKNGNVIGGEITLYRKALVGRADFRYYYSPLPHESYKLALDNPVPLNNFTKSHFNGDNFVMDQRYVKEQSFESINEQGNPLTVTDTYGNKGAFIYGQDGNVIAEVINARNDGIEYSITDNTHGWPFVGSGFPGNSFTVPYRQGVTVDVIYDPFIDYGATSFVMLKKDNETVPILNAAIYPEYPTSFSYILDEGRYSVSIDRDTQEGGGRIQVRMNTLSVSGMNNFRQVYHTSFEDITGAVVNEKAKTGRKVWSGVYQIPLSNFAPGSYILTYWQSTNGGTAWTKQTVTVNITAGMTSYPVGSAGMLIDEIRLLPPDAVITTYTYKPGVGKTSEMDHNGRVTYWEYDETGRLQKVLDNDRNLIKFYEYNIAHN